MSRKKLRKLKLISVILFFALVIEVAYVGYSIIYNNNESLYFDGINSVIKLDSSYITVGSNNDNDNYFEKAKIAKYDIKKNIEFEKLYNVGYNSTFFGVISDKNNIIAVGSYEKSMNDHKDLIRRGLFVKYDLSGNMEFDVEFKLLDNSKFTNVVSVSDGYIVTGQSIYKSTKIGSNEGGAILVKYDLDGNLLWYKTYGSSKSAIFNDLLVVDDYIYTVGMDDNHIGIICKYDLDGTLISYNDYKYTDEIGFSDIVRINNSIYVTGSNLTNAMIVKYDLDCNYIDQVVYKDDGNVRFNKLINDEEGNLILIGTIATNKKDISKTASDLNYDGIIGKYDSNLNEISVVIYGDERDDFFTDIIFDNKKYIVVGYSSYEDGSYLSKFITYSRALKVLEVN